MMGTLRAEIYGVSQSDMNSITTLQWKPKPSFIFNTVDVYAIDGTQQTLVFSGNIVNAWGNYQSMPDVFLQIQAQSAFKAQLTPSVHRSYQGTIDAATVMSQIADHMGYKFENNGATFQLKNPYFDGTDLDQAKSLVRTAGFWMAIDNGILAIMPANTPRNAPSPEISATSGLIGYPTFDGVGVNFQTYFNPQVIFLGTVKLVSTISQAAGQWIVTSVAHKLDSEKPGGSWHSTIRGNANGLAINS